MSIHIRPLFTLAVFALLLASCYNRGEKVHDAMVQLSEHQIDSLSFFSEHHYTNNFNFVVNCDTLTLLRQQPEELLAANVPIDTFAAGRHSVLVVADIRIVPSDSIDSVWVQLATEQSEFGWTRESALIPNVVPADTISQFILFFSDTHLIIFLVVIGVITVSYWIRHLLALKAPIVHFRDINTFYPTLLTILVAASATYYAHLQLFYPEMWRHFYYHPTLNPFVLPFQLGLFLLMVWMLLIVALAAVDDVRHQLPFGDAVLYLSGLMAVCAANYIIYSIATLYYIGYFLLAAYVYFALYRFWKFSRMPYRCGKCGAQMHDKGRCPICGAENF